MIILLTQTSNKTRTLAVTQNRQADKNLKNAVCHWYHAYSYDIMNSVKNYYFYIINTV